MKNLNIIKFFGSLFLILFSTKVFSQNPVDVKQINCDSLFNTPQSGACISIEKMPTLVESLAETQNKFLSIVDTSLFQQTILVKVYVDTSGSVLCSYIFQGNNNILDTLALSFVKKVKFTSAETRGKKLSTIVGIPFYSPNTNETNKLIMREGKWYDKCIKMCAQQASVPDHLC